MSSSILTTTIIFLLFLSIVPTSADPLCKWHGVAPFCFIGNSCPDGCLKTIESNKGDGMTCWFSHKNQCCCAPRIV